MRVIFIGSKKYEMHFLNLVIIIVAIITSSCNWTRDKAKGAANKTGEVVAKTGSEFVDGVAKGIEKSFSNEIVIAENLKTNGLKTGKILIRSTDSTTDNILSAYFIFEKDFDQKITVKVIDDKGLEYGRTTQLVSAKANEARYFDFVFDRRTNIDGKGKVSFE